MPDTTDIHPDEPDTTAKLSCEEEKRLMSDLHHAFNDRCTFSDPDEKGYVTISDAALRESRIHLARLAIELDDHVWRKINGVPSPEQEWAAMDDEVPDWTRWAYRGWMPLAFWNLGPTRHRLTGIFIRLHYSADNLADMMAELHWAIDPDLRAGTKKWQNDAPNLRSLQKLGWHTADIARMSHQTAWQITAHKYEASQFDLGQDGKLRPAAGNNVYPLEAWR